MANAFGIDQLHYQFQEEDGTAASATLLGTEDTALSRDVTNDSNIQLRILCNEVGGGNVAGTTNATWQLQRSIAGGSFANVTTSSTGVKVNTSSQLTDGGSTGGRLTGPGGATNAGGQQDDQNGAVTWTHPGNTYAEHVFGLTLIAADLSGGQAVTFQLLYDGALFTTTQNGAYTVTPTLNITQSGPPSGAAAGSLQVLGAAAAGALSFDGSAAAALQPLAAAASGYRFPTPVAAKNTPTTLDVDTTYLVRARVRNTGGEGDTDFRWVFNHASAGYGPITTTSGAVKAVADATFANDDDVPELFGGAETYVTNNNAASEDGTFSLPAGMPADSAFEAVLAFQLDSANVSDEQTGLIKLQVFRNAQWEDLDTDTQIASYTVNEGAATPAGVAVAALQPLGASAAGELIYVGSAAGALQHAIAAASGRAEAQGAAVAAMQNLVADAAGQHVPYLGSAAAALQHLEASAAGELIYVGSGAGALQNLAAAAAGRAEAQGSAATALQHITASATGNLVTIGAGAGALQHLIAAATGRAEAQGASAAALQALVADADGTFTATAPIGTAVAALQHLAAAAVGLERFDGSAAGALQHLTAAAVGRAEAQGAAAAALQALAASASGQLVYVGNAAASLEVLAAVASGAFEVSGDAAAALQALAASASGSFFEGFDGTAAVAVQNLIASAVGRAEAQGAAAAALQHLIATAAGLRVIEEVSGIAACTVTSRQEPWDDGTFWDDGTGWYEDGLLAEASGIFAQGAFSSAAAALQALEASAVGRAEAQAAAAAALQALVASASGELVYTGNAAAVLQALEAAAAGAAFEGPEGNAAAALQHLIAAASGDAEAQGTAAVELQHLIAVASGLCVSGQGSFLQQWRRLTLDTRMGM